MDWFLYDSDLRHKKVNENMGGALKFKFKNKEIISQCWSPRIV